MSARYIDLPFKKTALVSWISHWQWDPETLGGSWWDVDLEIRDTFYVRVLGFEVSIF